MDLAAELHREHLVRLVAQAVQKQRVDRCRFLSDQPGERGSFRAVSLARRAEASEQVHLKLGRRGQFVGRQLGGALVEVVGNAHRPNRVRAGRARAHLVELVHGRQDRPLLLHHHVQVRSQRDSGRSARRCGCGCGCWRRRGLFGFRSGAAVHHRRRRDHGAAHDELPAVEAGRNLRRHWRRGIEQITVIVSLVFSFRHGASPAFCPARNDRSRVVLTAVERPVR